MHEMKKGGPCGLPDGHAGHHRSEADMETRTDPIWWVIRFGSIGVALFGFLYKVTCETFMCAAVHDSWHYRPFTWLGVVGVLIALPAWATAVKSYR